MCQIMNIVLIPHMLLMIVRCNFKIYFILTCLIKQLYGINHGIEGGKSEARKIVHSH